MNKAYAIVGFEQRPLGNLPFVVEWIFLSSFPSNITFLNRVIYFFYRWLHVFICVIHMQSIMQVWFMKDGLKLFWKNLIRCLSCNKISIIQLWEYHLVYIGKIFYLINSLEMWMTFFFNGANISNSRYVDAPIKKEIQ